MPKKTTRVERAHHVTESGTHLVWLTVLENGAATWEIEGFGGSEKEADTAASEKLASLARAHGWKLPAPGAI